MNYKYNDVLLCDTKFGKIIAQYMAYRPDKDLIIIDFNKRLHQLDPKKIKLATEQDIRNRFEPIIEKCNEEIAKNKKAIASFRKQLKEYEANKQYMKELLDKNRDEHDSLVVMKEMLVTQNATNIGDIYNQINKVKDDGECLLESLKNVSNKCERTADAIEGWKSDTERAKINIKEAETEMKKLLEVLYANGEGTKKVSKASI